MDNDGILSEILSLFSDGSSHKREDIYNELEGRYSLEELGRAVKLLRSQGRLMTAKRRLVAPESLGYETGIFWSSGKGFGFIAPDKAAGDLYVPSGDSLDAWHDDRVLFTRTGVLAKNGRPQAKVIKILSRGAKELTGRLVRGRKRAYVEPVSSRYEAVQVPLSKKAIAQSGDLVSVALSSYGGGKGITGTINRVFGSDGTREASTEAILYEHGIIRDFPKSVLSEAAKLPQLVSDSEAKGRLDLRDELIFTIDGAEAKDLDDAVSLEELGDGSLRLGVHIADVSHYVSEGSALDKSARYRGTSVYFADQVVPMLPPSLSNGICSLNPQEDRLTLSVFIKLDAQGKILSYETAQSFIRSKERMTYEDCNSILEGGDSELLCRYPHISPKLRLMAGLSKKRETIRRNRGALFIESAESYISCNEKGEPIGIGLRERGVSERIIEEFMLLANEVIAKHLSDLDLPSVYRVHEKPTGEKLEQFSLLAANFGYQLRPDPDSFALQRILDQSKGRPEASLINSSLLHSMMKARYSPVNLGHYGLAAKNYCHFTAPIRRYPDLCVHRLLKLQMEGKLAGDRLRSARALAAEASESSSKREVASENAERNIEKLYKADYMRQFIGEDFEGTISGVRGFGVFVLLDNTVEGLISVTDLPGGAYEYDNVKFTLKSPLNGLSFSFGMKLKVKLVAANPATGQIDFLLSDSVNRE